MDSAVFGAVVPDFFCGTVSVLEGEFVLGGFILSKSNGEVF